MSEEYRVTPTCVRCDVQHGADGCPLPYGATLQDTETPRRPWTVVREGQAPHECWLPGEGDKRNPWRNEPRPEVGTVVKCECGKLYTVSTGRHGSKAQWYHTSRFELWCERRLPGWVQNIDPAGAVIGIFLVAMLIAWAMAGSW